MAKIDALLQHMMQRGATRALLRADAPALLESSAGTTQGQPLSGAQIEAMLDEILPIEARQSLQAQGFAVFTYALTEATAPAGAFNFEASQPGGQWQLEIRPAEVPFPTAMPTSVVQPIAENAPAVQLSKPTGPPRFDPMASAVAASPPPTNYAPGAGNINAGNSSGQGDASVLPAELQGFNWGALLGSWIWGLGNNVWLGLLGLVPCVGFFMRFYLGSKGNEMAWKSKRWDSVQSFRQVQTTWAVVGAVLIGLSLFMGLIMSAILFPVFARARENARRAQCQSQLLQLALGVQQFAQDHDGKLPIGTTMAQWKPQLVPEYLGKDGDKLFVCPSHGGAGESYAVNPALSGAKLENIKSPWQTPMFYETKPDLHLDGSNIAFADGHIKAFRADKAQDVINNNGETR